MEPFDPQDALKSTASTPTYKSLVPLYRLGRNRGTLGRTVWSRKPNSKYLLEIQTDSFCVQHRKKSWRETMTSGSGSVNKKTQRDLILPLQVLHLLLRLCCLSRDHAAKDETSCFTNQWAVLNRINQVLQLDFWDRISLSQLCMKHPHPTHHCFNIGPSQVTHILWQVD